MRSRIVGSERLRIFELDVLRVDQRSVRFLVKLIRFRLLLKFFAAELAERRREQKRCVHHLLEIDMDRIRYRIARLAHDHLAAVKFLAHVGRTVL